MIRLIKCPWCETVQNESDAFLGRQGLLVHYLCQDCGGGFSKKRKASKADGKREEVKEDGAK